MKTAVLVYIAFLIIVSFITLFLYRADKIKAKKKQWRIKEAVLLCFGFFGGGCGALLGMKLFRHKTKHWYFWAVNILGLIIQLAILVLLSIAMLK